MRARVTLAFTAPLALLAGCGETTPADESRVVPMDTQVPGLDEIAADPLPDVPQNALDQIQFAGTYSREAEDGAERLALDAAADTYTYTAPDGTVSTGSYRRMADNRRIELENIGGEPAYFSVADGAIFRLGSPDASADQITVSSQFRRDAARPGEPVARIGPTATSETVPTAPAPTDATPADTNSANTTSADTVPAPQN